jgi:hypothetical protein
MSGTLTFWENHIPREGELVYIFVGGKGFPSGVWKGELTSVGYNADSFVIPYEEVVEREMACLAEIFDDRAPINYRNKQPIGDYEVYPDAPGMEQLLNKLFEQKAEVKALKRKIDVMKETINSVVRGLLDTRNYGEGLIQAANEIKKLHETESKE